MTAHPVSKVLSLVILVLLVLSFGPRVVTGSGTPLVLAAFTYDPCVMCAVPGDAIFFNASTSFSTAAAVTLYSWDFGDGTPLAKTDSSQETHVYFFNLTLGKWLVTLTVQDGLGYSDSVSQVVEFNVAPSFTTQPPSPPVGWPTTFNASGTKIYQNNIGVPPGFQWMFGDGTNGTGILVTHRYQAPGQYRITLAVVTGQGDPSISRILTVRPTPIGTQKIQASFEDLNVTILATIAVNNTQHTITGTTSITVTNTTSGTTVFSKTFDLRIVYNDSMKSPRFLIAITATHPLTAASCTVETSTGQFSCFVSRNPDINGKGEVNIIDFSMVAFDFGAAQGSARYNSSVDLNDDGIIDITDVGIVGADYGAPVF